MTYRIPLVESTWGPEERKAIESVLDSGRLTMGEKVLEFEAAFAKMVKADHAIMVTSGSTALELAAWWLLDREGVHLVTMPAVTWPTTVWPFVRAGFHVDFYDVDPYSLLAEKGYVNDVSVALMGNRGHIGFIDDACESVQDHLAFVTCYSMFFSHHLNTMEGGVVATNSDEAADWFRSVRAHGWTRHSSKAYRAEAREKNPDIDERFLFTEMGFNFKPLELQAAVGLVQLKKLPEANEARSVAYDKMAEGIESLANILKPMTRVNNPSPFAFPVICHDKETKKRLQAGLERLGIETRPIAGGNLTRQPAFQKYKDRWSAGPLPGANHIHEAALFLGLYPGIDTDYVIKSIREAVA